jgi:peptidase M28-like protein/PKD domain-containing protein
MPKMALLFVSPPSLEANRGCRALLMVVLSVALVGCALDSPNVVTKTPTTHPIASGPTCAPLTAAIAGFPASLAVDCDYIYAQLVKLATANQHREAGQGSKAPGHDGFAHAWTQEILAQLVGFGPTVFQDTFPIQGYVGRPASVPAVNVEVTVAGALHPERVVVIGCHYDGFANSTESAYDDASGCVIMLGMAKALATHWRATHTAPARTLKFVLFDAEEQGILGSFHYVNETIAGDRDRVVAMLDEEQNGVAYPARAFGRVDQPFLPFITVTSPVNPSPLYENSLGRYHDQFQRWQNFSTKAIDAGFSILHAMQPGLTYLPNQTEEVFTQEQLDDTSVIQIGDDDVGGSDEVPFTFAGINCITMSGNFSYYSGNQAEPWAFPFDQPEDTVALMNQYTGGSGVKSAGTVLSLALPAVISLWMLLDPAVLGLALAPTAPVGAISDLPNHLQPGSALRLSAVGAYAPVGGTLHYQWDFGDGTTASGQQVSHAWANAGSYTLNLMLEDGTGKRTTIQEMVVVGQDVPAFHNRFEDFPPSNGFEPPNPTLQIPTPGPGTP